MSEGVGKLIRRVEYNESDQRVDKLVAGWINELSRNQVQELIKGKKVKVNGDPTKSSYRTKKGDEIWVDYSEQLGGKLIRPQSIELRILHEDQHVIGVNKPPSMVVHPAPGHPDGTLVNALLHHCGNLPQAGDPRRPGIVHRLDKDTSGALIAAKSSEAYEGLVQQFKAREIYKEYKAIVEGTFEEERGVIEAPIGRDREDKTRMAVTMSGKSAETHFEVERQGEDRAALTVKPITGRTHQVRVHFQYIGHPIVGDQRYGHGEGERLMLHSHRLRFSHPIENREIELKADVPEEFAGAI